jgi:hypothetical protein
MLPYNIAGDLKQSNKAGRGSVWKTDRQGIPRSTVSDFTEKLQHRTLLGITDAPKNTWSLPLQVQRKQIEHVFGIQIVKLTFLE